MIQEILDRRAAALDIIAEQQKVVDQCNDELKAIQTKVNDALKRGPVVAARITG